MIWREFDITNSFTFESSLFGYKLGNQIIEYNMKDFYELSTAFMKTLLEYNFLMGEIEFEMKISKGWLKPSKLKELTGKPAAEVLAKHIEEKKELYKKEQRRIQVMQSLNEKINKASIIT